ncbi:unnamed protein product [Rotaria sordida]|uniref:Uncharacterized protein n=1 Tax=Rotaria sordida TaxID=392033 RepID=A0A814FU47_9BILA|nr:unnamed protein product [Rotaria sordida]CAF0987595.1 unnamed protein product [Rotaria sordida]CAF1024929.1 unnamed protein product [Rotaria sordida]CAF1035795.1 unnamed protein product [Rotaria sordida]CAF3491230.1 unnamed protein product [Rotaria sordida]
MYSSKNSILLLGITISLVLLWCTVQPSYADTNEEHHVVHSSEEDDNIDGEIDEIDDLYRRASLRPYGLQQRASLRPFAGKRASLRPFAGKRASLRPFAGKRASLRPFAGKRASLRPANFVGKRKRRNILFYDE